jgi:hypothetical protein
MVSRGRGYRRMYQLTGLPGWMRFGVSPGWLGRSPTGLGPAASFLRTGQWPTPQAQAYWQGMQPGQVPYSAPAPVSFAQQMTREQELDFLKRQADMMRGHLEQIESRVRELEAKTGS